MADLDAGFIKRARTSEHVQLMGSPEQNWSLNFEPERIEAFLRERMASVVIEAVETAFGETTIGFDYSYPPGWEATDTYGTMRIAPQGSLSFYALAYDMTFDLLEELSCPPAGNKEIVVIFGEFRAFFHRPGMPRNEGIHRLQNATHIELTQVLMPHAFRED